MDYGQPVRFGVFITPEATERPLQLAVLADELGFDIAGIQDHPYQRASSTPCPSLRRLP